MPQRIIAREAGGPDVLAMEEFDPSPLKPDQIRVANHAVGVNFLDTYHRSGLYPRPYPSGLGSEAAGIVEAVGEAVHDIAVGTRVGYLGDGTYASHAVANAANAFILPDSIDFDSASALLLKGITAWMLVECVRPVQPGMSVLVHAAAGGVGQLVVAWVKANGGIVIAHAGTSEKAAIATRLGADHALSGGYDDLPQHVRDITDGKGADLVLDGVGKDSWSASIASVAKLGLIASYGNSSGPVPPIAPLELARAGSAFLTRPTLFDWIHTAELKTKAWSRLTHMIETGVISGNIGQRFALADAAEAHRMLESRKTVGATILMP